MEKLIKSISPIIKQTGGKTQHLFNLCTNLPSKYNDYYEPMVGGGALVFALELKNANINDSNRYLMNVYTQIKNNYEEVLKHLDDMEQNHCEDYYYNVRDTFNRNKDKKQLDAVDAAIYIYLNKTCFNGLFRTNKKGEFNVGWNKRDIINTYDYKNIRKMHNYLQNANITNLDYKDAVKPCMKDDFVYFDVPSTSEQKTKSPLEFDYEEHKKFINLVKELDLKGVKILITVQANDKINSLYDSLNFTKIHFNSLNKISCKTSKRTGQMILLKNY